MKTLSVNVPDSIIVVDGIGLKVDMRFERGLHALSWNDDHMEGYAERYSPYESHAFRDKAITKPYVDAWRIAKVNDDARIQSEKDAHEAERRANLEAEQAHQKMRADEKAEQDRLDKLHNTGEVIRPTHWGKE